MPPPPETPARRPRFQAARSGATCRRRISNITLPKTKSLPVRTAGTTSRTPNPGARISAGTTVKSRSTSRRATRISTPIPTATGRSGKPKSAENRRPGPRRKPPTKYCPSPTPLTNPLRRPRPRARTAATTAGTGSRTTGIIPAARGKIRASKIKTRNSSKTAAAGRTGSSQTRTANSQTSRDSSRAAGRIPASRTKTGSRNSRKRSPRGNRPTPIPKR